MSESAEHSDLATLEAMYRLSSGPTPRQEWLPAARAVLAAVAIVAVTMYLVLRSGDPKVDMLLGLPHDGLVAADAGAAQVGGSWVVTSGTLQMRAGQLWSGLPDDGPTDPHTGRTGSAVLRAVSTRRDFENVAVALTMRLDKLSTTRTTPSQVWDGVHVFLRYHDANHLYVVDLARRDGSLAIKRKTPGAGPTAGLGSAERADLTGLHLYTTLATTTHPIGGAWHRYNIRIFDAGDGVTITLAVDGNVLLRSVDNSPEALRGPGGVGIRGDNANFVIRTLKILQRSS